VAGALVPVRSESLVPRRIPALDAARALAVVAMVVGHTLDALLALSDRGAPLAVAYWRARGLTAPIFLVAAGWAVTVAIGRSGGRGPAVLMGRLPRILLLLVIAYALRWPGWGVDLLRAGDTAVWAHLLAFDALHAIALSIPCAALVLGMPWTVREKAGALALLATLSVSLGMGGTAPLVPDPSALPRSIAGLALAQAMGGTSPFALVPWSAYFFVGAIVGLLAGRLSAGRALAVGAVGVVAVLATWGTGASALPAGHPVLFLFRAGAVLVLFALLAAVPARAATTLAPLGRASLGVYALHVPIVYGWSTHEGLLQQLGPTLAPGRALLAAALVLAVSFAAHHAIVLALRGGREATAWAWRRRSVAAGLAVSVIRGARAPGR